MTVDFALRLQTEPEEWLIMLSRIATTAIGKFQDFAVNLRTEFV